MSSMTTTHTIRHEAAPNEAAFLTPGEKDMSEDANPMWEAMDCPDVTNDPFYDDFEGGE